MIVPFSIGLEEETSSLIASVFDEYVGYEYSEEGNRVFNDFISPGNIVERFINGNLILIYRVNDEIAGMIEIRDNNHICLFFVDKKHQGQGLGRALFQEALGLIKGKTDFLEVNASPYSEKIYSKLGFKASGGKTEKNGIIYIPMIMMLK